MVEWWLLSPNPVSVAMYSVWALWGMRKFKHVNYKRFSTVMRWVDALLCAGYVVLFGDIMWLIATGLKWCPVYPQWTMQVVYSLARNIVAVILINSINPELQRMNIMKWGKEVWILWLVNAYFLLIWFGTADILYETHWVHAYLNGANWTYAWFMSFVVGRIITTLVYVRQWNV